MLLNILELKKTAMEQMIDETDLKILQILQKDAKKTTKEIAQELNLTASPIYERIRKLEKKGIIKKYVALLDQSKLNIPVTAICLVSQRYHNEGFIEKFEEQIKDLNEVQECYHMAGKVDFFLKINVKSLPDYHNFIRTKLSKISNIGVLESYFVLKKVTVSTEYAI